MLIETTLDQMRQSYDWESALHVAFRDSREVLGSAEVSKDLFVLDDVLAVLASSEGMNDEESWIAVFQLKDGRFAFIAAWCDYTGWG
jgi:hypothetical protein